MCVCDYSHPECHMWRIWRKLTEKTWCSVDLISNDICPFVYIRFLYISRYCISERYNWLCRHIVNQTCLIYLKPIDSSLLFQASSSEASRISSSQKILHMISCLWQSVICVVLYSESSTRTDRQSSYSVTLSVACHRAPLKCPTSHCVVYMIAGICWVGDRRLR